MLDILKKRQFWSVAASILVTVFFVGGLAQAAITFNQNIQVGDNTGAALTMDGDDVFVNGTLEVDGIVNLGGAITALSTLTMDSATVDMIVGGATNYIDIGPDVFSTGTLLLAQYDTAEVLTAALTGASIDLGTSVTTGGVGTGNIKAYHADLGPVTFDAAYDGTLYGLHLEVDPTLTDESLFGALITTSAAYGTGTEVGLRVTGDGQTVNIVNDADLYISLAKASTVDINFQGVSPVIDIGADVFNTGTFIDVAYDTAEVQAGDLTGLSLNLNTSLTGTTDFDVAGVNVQTPALAATDTGVTTTYTGYNISAAGTLSTVDGALGAAVINWRGVNITMPAITAETGDTVTAYGILISAGTVTNGLGTETSIAIDATDTDIVTALDVAANDIVGTTGLINYTNFDVDAAGKITTADDVVLSSGKITVDTVLDETSYVKRNQATTATPVFEIEATATGDTNPALLIDHNGTGNAMGLQITHDGDLAALDITAGAVRTGNVINIPMANQLAETALDITGVATGTSGEGIIHVDVTGVLAGNAIRIDSTGANATTGQLIYATSSGTQAGATNGIVGYFTDTGTAAATSYTVYIASTNNEGLYVDTGKVLFDENLTIASGGINVTAGNVVRSINTALTALAGGAQAGTALNKDINIVTVVATAADSVQLPVAVSGMEIVIINRDSADSMNVYGQTGDGINGGGANGAYAVAAAVRVVCTATGAAAASVWECQKTAR